MQSISIEIQNTKMRIAKTIATNPKNRIKANPEPKIPLKPSTTTIDWLIDLSLKILRSLQITYILNTENAYKIFHSLI